MGYKVGLRRLRREIIRVMGKVDHQALQLAVGQEERRGVGCGDHEFNGTSLGSVMMSEISALENIMFF